MSDKKYDRDYIPSTSDLVEEGEIAADYIENFLDILEFEGDLDLDVQENRALVTLVGNKDTKSLIGKFGSTLNAIQYLTRLAVQEKTGYRSKLLFDIDTWREDQRNRLITYADKKVEDLLEYGEEVELRSMSSYERKIIHDHLTKNKKVKTESRGEDPDRRIVISKK